MGPDYFDHWERQRAAFNCVLRQNRMMDCLSRVDFSAYSAAAAALQSADLSHLAVAYGAASSLHQPGVAQMLESLNVVSNLIKPCSTATDQIKPSVIQSLIGISSAVDAATSRIETAGILDSLSVFQKIEKQMSAGARALESFGTFSSAWSKTIDRIYADDLDISPFTEDELEETVESPEV